MTAQLNKDWISLFKNVSEYSSILIVFIGILVLIGWAFDIALLKSPGSGFSTIKSNVGLAFILIGISLWLQQTNRINHNNRRIAQILALAAALIGFLTLTEYLFNVNIGLDQILFKEAAGALNTSSPNRMALSAAFSLFIAGIAIAFMDVKFGRDYGVTQILALIGGFLSLFSLTGYVYGVSLLFHIPQYTAIALYAALTFALIFLSILFSRPDSGIIAILSSENVGGSLARRLMPAILILPLILGLIWKVGESVNLYGHNFGYALFAFSSIIFLLLLMWAAIVPINRIEDKRK
jgi:hypothetical protein